VDAVPARRHQVLQPEGAVAPVLVNHADIRGKDVGNGTIGSSDIENGGLLAEDFKARQLPAGGRRPQGERGPQGHEGPPGQDATKLFAYVRDAGSADTVNVQYGSDVTAVSDPAGSSGYTVTFNRSLVNCVVQAMQGIGEPSGSAATPGTASPDVGVILGGADQLVVTFYNNASAVVDTAFMIAAFC
jgi:hypothetical protein